MFHGLSAFPLTPLKDGTFDEQSFINLLRPVVDAGVDSLGILWAFSAQREAMPI